ncbi:MAG: LacI family DNA-binding transcriptional regulator, partial [Trebonia sp.]
AAPARRRPTIEDVARLAGVSRGTVSRVLNGGRNVRPAVLDAVNAAIDALGYSVNQTARNLARGRTGSIAFVISDREESLFEDPNFGLFARVFSRELRKSGRHLLITTAQDEAEENFLGDYLTLGHVDGALLALTHEEQPLLGRLLPHRLPLVVLGKPLGFEDAFSWVAIDDEAAAFTVVSYLADRVDGAIGIVTGPLHTSSGRERLDGYRRALGDQFRPDLVATGDWSLSSGHHGTGQLLARDPGLRGLFVASDLMAAGAIGALREAGRRVPDDVSVVGFDDSAAATMVEPALTTMRNPIEQTALEALRILDDQIAGRVRRPVHLLLGSELIERGSG